MNEYGELTTLLSLLHGYGGKTDNSLSQPGYAADAKVVGEKFSELQNDIENIRLLVDDAYEEVPSSAIKNLFN